MSLVDYASSSEDEGEAGEQGGEDNEKGSPPSSVPESHSQGLTSSSTEKPDNALHASTPSIEKLPDASLLLSSPTFSSHQIGGSDHSSRVAAAMAQSASRKRESNGPTSSYPRSKIPRGNLPHSRSVPDTIGGLLRPPQLNGRSNIVTEDISKLFVKRRSEPASH
ncbi:PREDICTED: uncharacterized protein LOC104613438 isoform X2 [Nelumbo nucifera]|uniref:Uncharacterized protein LOC104613438 isoform X2 n=1 Tax=Nelumbo nucifera TaxID=4432 RepID=A0A1U8QBT5_NELNU|nr:PREDICTED: uncharacterized protein LOC104613438 isoform X2 [Nelumbo nucifera]